MMGQQEEAQQRDQPAGGRDGNPKPYPTLKSTQTAYLRSIFLSVLLSRLKSMKVSISMCWMKLRVTSSS